MATMKLGAKPEVEPVKPTAGMVGSDPDTALVAPDHTVEAVVVGGIDGDFDPRDYRPPRLTLVQGSGANVAKYDGQGKFVLGELILAEPKSGGVTDPELHIAVIGARKFWEEPRPYDPDNKTPAMRWYHRQDVLAAGYTVDWTDGPNGKQEKPTAVEGADLLLLIRQPGPTVPGFGMELPKLNGEGTEFWAPALWTIRQTSWFAFKKSCLTMIRVNYRNNAMAVTWGLKAAPKKAGRYNPYTPTFRLIGVTTPEWRKAVQEVLPKSASPAPDAE